nr:unnamed protein product [Digitaria exilis]
MYAVGDTDNGVCCLVGLVGSINNLHLQVWLLKEDGAAKTWVPERKFHTLGYLLQMPWPPAVLVVTRSETINCAVVAVTQNLSAIEENEVLKCLTLRQHQTHHQPEQDVEGRTPSSGSISLLKLILMDVHEYVVIIAREPLPPPKQQALAI